MKPQEHLCIALDTSHEPHALELVRSLKRFAHIFKIGLQLYSSVGPSIIETVTQEGVSVFLDLKLNDIPNTVAGATEALLKYHPSFLTVHALAGENAIRAAVDATKTSPTPPKIIAVTLLTSMDERTLNRLGIHTPPEELVLKLAESAVSAGANGIVASPKEASKLRRLLPDDALIVTPGIRMEQVADDQKRVATPEEALHAGADILVVGRPITASADPQASAEKVLARIQATLEGNRR